MTRSDRLLYIDNIRVFLTVIVLLHHLAITYGAPGGWYYREFEFHQLDTISLAVLVLFSASNQAYFMAFFFFLSGYFSGQATQDHQPGSFLVQRVIRLGVPVLLFVYILSPALKIIRMSMLYSQQISWVTIEQIYQNLNFGIELGPMWFIVLLLIFSALLPIVRRATFSLSAPNEIELSISGLTVYGFVLGLITFLVRIAFPIGYVFQPLNLQIPFVVQYIGFFSTGVLAFQYDWLEQLETLIPKYWRVSLIFLVLLMPVIYILSGGLSGDVTPALGGIHWQSLVYSIWEEVFCISVIIMLLQYFKKNHNNQNKLSIELAASSYAVYIIHAPILVMITILLRDINFHPLLKILLSALPVIVINFLLAGLIRRLPGLRSII